MDANLKVVAGNTTPKSITVKAADGQKGVEVFFDVTAVPTTDSVTCSVYAKDARSTKRVLLVASTTRTAIGTERLVVYPGVAAVANVSVNNVIGDAYDVEVVHVGTGLFSYTVSAKPLA